MTEPLNIEIKDAQMGYGKNVVLTNVSLTPEAGKIHCVFGRNGSGKTTFLKTMAGLIPLIRGEIKIGREELETMSSEKRAKILAIVLTHLPKISNINVSQYVSFGRYPYTNWLGIDKSENKQPVLEAIKMCGLEKLKNRALHELSDGEMQKVMIARVLAQDVPVLFLDEVASHLDTVNKAEIFELIRLINKRDGRTVFFTSHDIQFSMQLADSFVLVENAGARQMSTDVFLRDKIYEDILKSDYLQFDASTFAIKYGKKN